MARSRCTKWRWRVLHSPEMDPALCSRTEVFNLVHQPSYEMDGFWLPVGPRVGLLGYLDDPRLPPKRPPFSEHRELTLSWAEWFNGTAFSDTTLRPRCGFRSSRGRAASQRCCPG